MRGCMSYGARRGSTGSTSGPAMRLPCPRNGWSAWKVLKPASSSYSISPEMTTPGAIQPFTYRGLPARVVFGVGTLAQAPRELEQLGVTRALVLTTPAQVDQGRAVVELLGDRAAGM